MSIEKTKFIVLENGHVLKLGEGGGDKIFKYLFKFLPEEFEVHVIIPAIAAHHWEKIKTHPKLHKLPGDIFLPDSNYFKIGINYIWRSYQSIILINNFRSNKKIFLYSSTETIPDVLPAFFNKVIFSKKYIWIEHSHHIIQFPFKRRGNIIINSISYLAYLFSIFCIRFADQIFVVNELEKFKLLKYNISSKKISVSPAGIDLNEIKKSVGKKINKNNFEAIFIGRIHPVKGVFDIPEIWQYIIKVFPGAKVVIAGNGSHQMADKLINLFKERGVSDKNYKIFGFVSERMKFELLNKSKIFLFTDHEAGWGIAPAEALACGLPVIGYDIGILGNVFKKGYLKVSPYNTSDFAEQIIKVLKDGKKYKKMQADALVQAKELGWEKTGEKFADLIKSIKY